MALKDICSYTLDGDFNELFGDVEIEKYSDAAVCVVYRLPCTAQEIVRYTEVMEGSEREAQGKAGATGQASLFTKIYAYMVNSFVWL